MTSDLTSWVSARVDADAKLTEDAKLLILAALEGETALADMAGYTPPTAPTAARKEAEPVGAFLKRSRFVASAALVPSRSWTWIPSHP